MRANFRNHRAPCVGQPWMGEITPRASCTALILNFTIVFFVSEREMTGRSVAIDVALDPFFLTGRRRLRGDALP